MKTTTAIQDKCLSLATSFTEVIDALGIVNFVTFTAVTVLMIFAATL